jgi:phosphohistidine phosphatase
MNLYILRHASAGTRRPNPQLDLKRPLDKEGKAHCLHLAHVLNALKVTFDTVVSSPLKRSLQTAQLVATETGFESRILLSDALAPEATYADFLRLLQQYQHSENLLVVGHSPNIQSFLGSLLVPQGPELKPALIRMRKGTIARVSMSRGPGVLTSVLDPRTVKALYRTSQATSTKSSRRKTSRK